MVMPVASPWSFMGLRWVRVSKTRQVPQRGSTRGAATGRPLSASSGACVHEVGRPANEISPLFLPSGPFQVPSALRV